MTANRALRSSQVVNIEDLRHLAERRLPKSVFDDLDGGAEAELTLTAAVVVSNHGGRQLDSVSPSLRALPEVVAAVNGQIEVLMDGGVRPGSDIIKAICLGARAVLIGRAYAYGLAAAGEAGVARAIEILRGDLERTLRLLGCPSVTLDRSYVQPPHAWSVR